MTDEPEKRVSLEERVEFLEDALALTQDRLMACETALRVLMAGMHRTGAVPAYQLLSDFQAAARQLHGRHGEEFPLVLRALNLFRAFAAELEGVEPPA